jgi:hypothetical protein
MDDIVDKIEIVSSMPSEMMKTFQRTVGRKVSGSLAVDIAGTPFFIGAQETQGRWEYIVDYVPKGGAAQVQPTKVFPTNDDESTAWGELRDVGFDVQRLLQWLSQRHEIKVYIQTTLTLEIL